MQVGGLLEQDEAPAQLKGVDSPADAQPGDDHHIRLSFSPATSELTEGVRRLTSAWPALR